MMEAGLLLLPLAAGYWYLLGRSPSKNSLRKKTTAKLPVSGPQGGSMMTRGWLWFVLAVLAGFIFMNGTLPPRL